MQEIGLQRWLDQRYDHGFDDDLMAWSSPPVHVKTIVDVAL